MSDEQHYVGTLLELDEALMRLPDIEAHITYIAYMHWQQTLGIEEQRQPASIIIVTIVIIVIAIQQEEGVCSISRMPRSQVDVRRSEDD
ncbi:hypothetical protein B0F90DRAFT_1825757 [Multifurca ochricompacta]|uniref:Uncharacterized protein n=1 Tax=Multifurca ochricompacta TaxID=376703 RepID=A0AAD4LTW2_9AGAM|nr:hypothetical protein B0F90DRAFT_1825757 [Multifurca ochricompacta]